MGWGASGLFFDPLSNQLGSQDDANNRCAYVDYTAKANQYLKQQSGGRVDLGTRVTGTVTEQALRNGTAEITVRLQVTDALVFAVTG
jgi:hypothetical protein